MINERREGHLSGPNQKGVLCPKELNQINGIRKRKIHHEVEEIIKWAVKRYCLFPVSQVAEIIYERIEDENKKRDIEDYLQVPSISTIKKRILSIAEAEKGAKKKIMNLVNIATYPLQRASVFHTGLDVVAIDDKGISIGRPFLSVVIDEFSGYPLGYYLGFEKPSYETVKLALYHAISSKSYVKERYPGKECMGSKRCNEDSGL